MMSISKVEQGGIDPSAFLRNGTVSIVANNNPANDVNCSGCNEPFINENQMINAKGKNFHSFCFVCVQCFQTFKDGIYYEIDGNKYCEFDFHMLFAPTCRACKQFISGGRVIKAMNFSWHPECFRCNDCNCELSSNNKNGSNNFVKSLLNPQLPLCRECGAKEKSQLQNYNSKNSLINSQALCARCHTRVEDCSKDSLRFRKKLYHAYHFSCKNCSEELKGAGQSREIGNELYCLRCVVDNVGIEVAICAACHTPIDQERIVNALGKQWHVEHFACTKCENPFNGSRHYERKGLAYCEVHFNQLFGTVCFVCNAIITGDYFAAMNKTWCADHFCCHICDELMSKKTKFYDLDSKPVCKRCFDKLPSKTKSSILKSSYELPLKQLKQHQASNGLGSGLGLAAANTSISSASTQNSSPSFFSKKK